MFLFIPFFSELPQSFSPAQMPAASQVWEEPHHTSPVVLKSIRPRLNLHKGLIQDAYLSGPSPHPREVAKQLS